jgi:hypothetical protein
MMNDGRGMRDTKAEISLYPPHPSPLPKGEREFSRP